MNGDLGNFEYRIDQFELGKSFLCLSEEMDGSFSGDHKIDLKPNDFSCLQQSNFSPNEKKKWSMWMVACLDRGSC